MGDTYRNVAKVLVIDSGVRQCSINTTVEQILLRIVTSGWMQRLWTFREAVLAKALIFELSTVSCPPAADLFLGTEFWVKRVQSDLVSVLYRLSKGGSELGFHDIVNALRGQTTSRAEDETLAVASLLHVDTFKLANLPPDERTITLLSDIQHLPSTIIFMRCNKQLKPGFRWAAETLMTPRASVCTATSLNARCTPDGLIAQYQALIFEIVTLEHGKDWFSNEKSTDSSGTLGRPQVHFAAMCFF